MRTKILSILVVLMFFISPVMAIEYDYYDEVSDSDETTEYIDGICYISGYDNYYLDYGYTEDEIFYTYSESDEGIYSMTYSEEEFKHDYEIDSYIEKSITEDEIVYTYSKSIEESCSESYSEEEFERNRKKDIYTEDSITEDDVTETEFSGYDLEVHIEGEDPGNFRVDYSLDVYEGTEIDTVEYTDRYQEGTIIEGYEIEISYVTVDSDQSDPIPYEINTYTDKTTGEVTVVKEEGENCMSSPSMGIGLKLPDGTITKEGDKLPTLYTWAEKDDKWEHHTTLYFPAEGTCTGCVIVTPPQTAGVPIQEKSYWDTAKAQRYLEWKANSQ